jgi:hypothetical protein
MRPKAEPKQPQRELFQVDLEQLIDLRHPLAVLVAYSGEVGQSRSEATLVVFLH